jgi:hypothetical protein
LLLTVLLARYSVFLSVNELAFRRARLVRISPIRQCSIV